MRGILVDVYSKIIRPPIDHLHAEKKLTLSDSTAKTLYVLKFTKHL